MELRHLRYLVAIADAGTFVRAAERLRVAQPALTRQMHDLEEELGAELFEPTARKATLTLAGKACVRLAQHVIQDTEQAVARARLSNSGVIGKCVLATGPVPLASGLVAEFIARMRARFPGITITVAELAGADQWVALERAEADIGLGIAPQPEFSSLSSAMQYLHVVDHVAVASSHELASRERLSLADLVEYPMLALDQEVGAAFARILAAIETQMRAEGLPFERVKQRHFSSIESLTAHVRAGQGWSVAPLSAKPLLAGIALVKLPGFEAILPTMRIWRRSETRPAILTILDQLRRFKENRADEGETGVAVTESDRDVVPPRIELRHLRSFVAVTEHGSLGRAAEVMGVTQPALSRQMRELEYDVGVALFSRESRGMDITPAGETFRDDVADVLSVVDKIPREIHRAERAREQRCVIAVVPHPDVDLVVARVVAELEARGERVRVGTRQILTVHHAKALHAGEVDIGLGHKMPLPKHPGPSEHLITVPLTEDRICTALLPRGHALASRPALHLRDLADIPFLGANRSLFPDFYDMVFNKFAAGGLRPRIEAEYDGLSTIWSLALQGAGWVLGWKSHLREPPPGLVAVPLADFDLPWGIVLTYRQDEARVPVLATIDSVVEHAKTLSGVNPREATLPSAHNSEAPIS